MEFFRCSHWLYQPNWDILGNTGELKVEEQLFNNTTLTHFEQKYFILADTSLKITRPALLSNPVGTFVTCFRRVYTGPHFWGMQDSFFLQLHLWPTVLALSDFTPHLSVLVRLFTVLQQEICYCSFVHHFRTRLLNWTRYSGTWYRPHVKEKYKQP